MMRDVEAFWGLSDDPFRPGSRRIVPTPGQDEAVARIVDDLESGSRRIVLRAESGVGKTIVLDRVAERLHTPRHRVGRLSAADSIPSQMRTVLRMTRSDAGSDLVLIGRAIRVLRLQGGGLTLIVDDMHLATDESRRILTTLQRGEAQVPIIEADRDAASCTNESWPSSIRLDPLSRSEAGAYLAAKLLASGRSAPLFSPGAVTKMHGIAQGIPRRMDRLASSALRSGAERGREVVTSETVESAGIEGSVEPPHPGHASSAAMSYPTRTGSSIEETGMISGTSSRY